MTQQKEGLPDDTPARIAAGGDPLAYPKVTIGLPVYNGEPTLRDAIDSLLGQSFRDFELIISDNASTDSTYEICEEYARRDPRVVLLCQAHNRGAVNNFRAVAEHARAEYFMWAAADDVWLPGFIARLYEELETHPQAGVAMCAVHWVRSDGSMIETVRFQGWKNPNDKDYRALLRLAFGPCKLNWFIYGLFRSRLLKPAVRLFPTSLGGDRQFLGQFALATQYRYVDEVHYVRTHSVHNERQYRDRAKRLSTQLGQILSLARMLLYSPIIPWTRKWVIPNVLIGYAMFNLKHLKFRLARLFFPLVTVASVTIVGAFFGGPTGAVVVGAAGWFAVLALKPIARGIRTLLNETRDIRFKMDSFVPAQHSLTDLVQSMRGRSPVDTDSTAGLGSILAGLSVSARAGLVRESLRASAVSERGSILAIGLGECSAAELESAVAGIKPRVRIQLLQESLRACSATEVAIALTGQKTEHYPCEVVGVLGDGLIEAYRRSESEKLVGLRERLEFTVLLDDGSNEILLAVESNMCRSRARAGLKEPWTIQWIERFVRPGDVFYDVGANVGAYSLVAAHRSRGQARVYAFEPSFSTYAVLCRNVLLNGYADCVFPLPLALGRQPALDWLNYAGLDAGAALHSVGDKINYKGEAFEPVYRQALMVQSIDELALQMDLPAPNHIKIDVDGTEMAVLHGARQTLHDETLSTLLIEINEVHSPSQEVITLLGKAGLQITDRHDRANPTGDSPAVSYLLFTRH